MYIKEYLKQYEDKKVKLFVDMDGVIADYVVGAAVGRDYDTKRPLFESINKLEEVSKLPNVEMFILSCTRYNEGFEQKQVWLDKYAPFFKKENRVIVSREANNMEKTEVLKAQFMRDYPRDDSVLIVIDDDPRNLNAIKDLCDDVVLLKDTVLDD